MKFPFQTTAAPSSLAPESEGQRPVDMVGGRTSQPLAGLRPLAVLTLSCVCGRGQGHIAQGPRQPRARPSPAIRSCDIAHRVRHQQRPLSMSCWRTPRPLSHNHACDAVETTSHSSTPRDVLGDRFTLPSISSETVSRPRCDGRGLIPSPSHCSAPPPSEGQRRRRQNQREGGRADLKTRSPF